MKTKARDILTVAASTVLIAAGLVWLARDLIGLDSPWVAAVSIGGLALGFLLGVDEVRQRHRRDAKRLSRSP